MTQYHLHAYLARRVGADVVELSGDTVGHALRSFAERYPDVIYSIVDDQFRLRPHVSIFINSELIGDRDGLSDAVSTTDRVHITGAISGG